MNEWGPVFALLVTPLWLAGQAAVLLGERSMFKVSRYLLLVLAERLVFNLFHASSFFLC